MNKPKENIDYKPLLKEAYLQLKQLKEKVVLLESAQSEPIAVIGLACRFPGAPNAAAYWDLLKNGTNAVTPLPADRAADWQPAASGNINTWGGYIKEVSAFDAQFFGISSREATYMDPQQRILLEVCWEALEQAGITDADLAGSATGVFTGVSSNDYARTQFGNTDQLSAYSGTGNAFSIVANRISYFLDVKGPSMAIDTACSSSLVAVNEACQSLRKGSSNMAIAAGINLMLSPELNIVFGEANMLAPDGKCKTYDEKADGYVRGEGCGVVILKRLSDAEKDGDRILAIIRGVAVNQDGRSNGLTAPNGISQQAVIKLALQDAGVSPAAIGYVEAHGTGTPLGDPIEMSALKAVLMEGRKEETLWVGTAKTNIGHLEAAAGIAGLIKTILILQHGEIPPHLHFQVLNPKISLTGLPVHIPLKHTSWTTIPGKKRLAGVSSFGFGGTNSHVVIEEPPVAASLPARQAPAQLLTLSAKTPEALRALCNKYLHFLQNTAADLTDLCYTAAVGRSHFNFRLAVTGNNTTALMQGLDTYLQKADHKLPSATVNALRRSAFLFTGQGAQYVEMGKALYDHYPVFRQIIDTCETLLSAWLPVPLTKVLFQQEAGEVWLHQTAYSQPAIFAFEYAMAMLLQSFGIIPDAVMGHSVGEYAAACVAGVFSLEDGLKLIAARATLMQQLPPDGLMLVVFAPAATVKTYLSPFVKEVAIASVNAPALTVISGAATAVTGLQQQFEQAAIKTQPLKVSHAFHSPLMQPMLADFREVAIAVHYRAPRIRFISNLTGESVADAIATPAYWTRHIMDTVQFETGIKSLEQEPGDIWIEVGPSPHLLAMCRGFAGKEKLLLPTADPKKEGLHCLLQAVGKAYMHGVKISWKAVYSAFTCYRTDIPTYPFQSKKYWIAKTSLTMEASAINGKTFSDATITPVAAPVAGRRESILDHLRSIIAAALKEQPDSLDTQLPFIEMGADSLLMAEMVHKIEKQYQLRFTISQLFEEVNTLELMATYIDQQLSAATVAAPATTTPVQEKMVVNGGTAHPDTQQIIKMQLELMQQQLNVLQTGGAVQSISTAPETTTKANTNALKLSAAAKPAVSIFPKKETNKSLVKSLTAAQQEHLDLLITRYNKKTPGSKAIAQRYRPVLADNRVSAGFRFSTKEMLYPIIGKSSKGSRMWDVDGNEYVDIAMGFGVNLFGHRPDFVTTAITDQLQQGMQLGPQTDMAGIAAELVAELTGMDRVSFHNSGTEAVMTALRLARTVTGRNKVVIFKGSYHGHFDGTLGAAQDPLTNSQATSAAPGVLQNMITDLVVLEYGNEASLSRICEIGNTLAAILVEPVQSRNPDLQPKAFLQQLRDITAQHGIALIFDEMITGFRIHPGGAQAWFGVKADLATYGKIVGGGMPIGVVAGKALFMDSLDGGMWQYGDDSYPAAETTFFAGTFCKHPITLAAACALLKAIKEQGATLYEQLNSRTTALVRELNNFFAENEAPIKVGHFGSLFYFSFTGNMDLFFYHLTEKGVYTWEGRTCFLSTAHTTADIAFIIRAVKESIYAMQAGGFLPRKALTPAVSIPLTGTQQQLWALTQMDTLGSIAYNITAAIQVKGTLQAAALHYAVQEVVKRHEALRTVISVNGNEQTIFPVLEVTPRWIDFTEIIAIAERNTRVASWKEKEGLQPFDLATGPLIRVHVLQLEADLHEVMITLHHIVADGWSLSILLQEIAALYTGYCTGIAAELPSPMQFREHLRLQEALNGRPEMQVQEEYWLQVFSDCPEAMELPLDNNRPAIKTYKGGRIMKTFTAEHWTALKQIGKEHGCTPFMTMLAACTVLIHRLTMQEEVVIGIPVGGRPFNDYMIGACANLVPVKSSISAVTTFAAQLSAIRQTLLQAFRHQDYPFSRLLDKLNMTRDLSRSPIIEVLFNFNPNIAEPIMYGLSTALVEVDRYATAYDLSFDITEIHDGLSLACDYNADLFDAATIERYCNFYEEIIKSIITGHQQPVAALEMLTASEKQQVLVSFNDTSERYPENKTIPELFEIQVAATPHQLAVIAGEKQLTYDELNKKANQIAALLKQQYKVGPGQLVGMMLERTELLLAGVLGILKSGAAYIPLDPVYPESRIKYMLQDSGLQVVLTTEKYRHYVGDDITTIILDTNKQLKKYPTANPAVLNKPDDLMYVIYTSGSTGLPKGVQLRHRNAVAFVSWCKTELAAHDFDITYYATSYCFDISVFEMFYPLTAGKTIRVMENALEIKQHLPKDEKVLISIVPAVLESLVKEATDFSAVKVINVCGEPFPFYLKAKLDYERMAVYNLYGPTEDTVYSTCYQLSAEDDCMLIGRPIANSRVYILDQALKPVPVGVTGEIYLAGAGLAAGYLHKEVLTAERFIANPFEPGELMYKTGDLASWHANGMLEHKGRTDNQVKVRGFRIELGEIETVMLQYNEVEEVLVIVKEDTSGERFLAAYFTAAAPIDTAGLQQHLGRCLPAYMIPAYFMQLEAMPMTANGKRDRKALPEPDLNAASSHENMLPPASSTEEQLKQLWEGILGHEVTGTNIRFFETGGHSLKAVRLISALQETFNIRVTLSDIFAHQTIQQQAIMISQAGSNNQEAITPVAAQADYEVSHAQRRLWMMNEFESGQTAFNITGSAILEGRLDIPAFHQAFHDLVARHEILRTTFIRRDADGEPRQVIHPVRSFNFEVEYIDARTVTEQDKKGAVLAAELSGWSFDLEKGPLMRVSLLHLDDHRCKVFFAMHHIISDGWSLEVLIKDLFILYTAALNGTPDPLTPLPIHYKDYTAWRNGQSRSQSFVQHKKYWLQQFENNIPVLNLPTDFPRPAILTYSGATKVFHFDAAFSNSITQLARENEVTAFVVVLTAVNLLLYRNTGDKDIVIGIPLGGRDHTQLENQIGFYTNMIPLISRLNVYATFSEILKKTGRNFINAYEHGTYPFNQIVEDLHLERNAGRSQLFDVMVQYQQFHLAQESNTGIVMRDVESDDSNSKFDMTFVFEEHHDALQLTIVYNTDLFTPQTITKLQEELVQLMQLVMTDTSITPVALKKQLMGPDEAQISYATTVLSEDF